MDTQILITCCCLGTFVLTLIVYKTIKDKLNLYKSNIAKLNSSIQSNEKEIQDKNSMIAQLKECIQSNEKELQDKNSMITQLKECIQSYEKEIQDKNSMITQLKECIQSNEKEIQDKDSMIAQLKECIQSNEKEIQDKNSMITQLKECIPYEKEIQDKNSMIAQLEECIQSYENEIQDKNSMITQLKECIQSYEKEIQNKNSMIAQQLQEDNDILNDASKTLDQIEILKRKVNQLEEIKGCLENKCKVLKGEASNKENTAKLWKEKYDELREKGNKNIPEIIIEEATNTTILNPTISSIPLINDETKRKINIVVDVETGEEINANDFFSKEERFIFKMRSELQKAIYLRKPKYICKYYGQMVKISGRKTERGAATFFSHLYDSGECDYKTTTDRTKREIECEKYSRCNEGERHKKLKESLAHYLEMTEGISNVRTENTMKGEHPILNWRRPDIAASYKNIELIFELQLSTTFVSVITERDMF